MNTCIFCQIVSGEKPCYKIYEDRDFLAFLDNRPFTAGHTLLIPKKHYRWVWEIKDPGLFEAAAKISRKIVQNLGVDFVSYLSLGLLIDHAHLHLIPRNYNDGLLKEQNPKKQTVNKNMLMKAAKKIMVNANKSV